MTNATHYLDIEGLGVCWRVWMNFRLRQNVVTKVYQTNPNLSVIFPFVNDAEQLKQAIRVLRQHGFTGKVGTMIELPSAYFDLDRILELVFQRL